MAAGKTPHETILVVDDDSGIARVIMEKFAQVFPNVITCGNGKEALRIVETTPVAVIITDMRMAGMDGLELLKRVKQYNSNIEVIVITAHPEIDKAVEAMKMGAYDYITKPFKLQDLQSQAVRALEKFRLVGENQRLKTNLIRRFDNRNLIGRAGNMKEVFETIEIVKDTDSNVLIYGETGTGKELVAHAIHYRSRRKEEQFVKVNCAAIPRELLESELFGHEKGAFIGAIARRTGRFEMADHGTIFLDEIGDMPLDLQAKLITVLQDRAFERVGGTATISVDVRVIASTHSDLASAVKQGAFREDLYYLLNVVCMVIPPLRKHRDDIPLLVEHLLRKLSARTAKQFEGLAPQAMQALLVYDWPGNVRELENVIERSAVMAKDSVITLSDLPPHLRSLESDSGEITVGVGTAMSEIERLAIMQTLASVNGSKKKAAEMLSISEKSIYNKIKRYGIAATK
jgi:DNA-binding NtrC family response regulator